MLGSLRLCLHEGRLGGSCRTQPRFVKSVRSLSGQSEAARKRPFRQATAAVQGGTAHDDHDIGAVVPPIHISSTYRLPNNAGYDYARAGHPGLTSFEELVAGVEKQGAFAVAYSSGLAALHALLHVQVPAGAHMVAGDELYGGSFRLIETLEKPRLGLSVDWADLSDAERLPKLLRPDTRLVYFETPTNPGLKLVDIERAVEACRRLSPQALLVVDGTFMGPTLQSPLALGADLVLHSVTKCLAGHGDVVGGVLIGPERHCGELEEKLRLVQRGVGSLLSPLDCYLASRGIRTLVPRIETSQATARKIAEFLQKHPAIDRVVYPGLPGFQAAELAGRQMRGPGYMITFELHQVAGEEAEAARNRALRVLERLRLWHSAVSLGAVTSLAQHPASMTHATVPASIRERIGISERMLRLSVGLEDAEDLIDDLTEALADA
eukprot:TRINITY_DN112935_c0_g1_i1.p1 TRINITY_DN112935_c0_g1~~TRINITY_DN112935_c0_g1_i1.p1  ORF type:complete len:437 (-),score=67.18 TRINITY_DN112935_c0_g1_i1:375-1685(-)